MSWCRCVFRWPGDICTWGWLVLPLPALVTRSFKFFFV
jgi:hypothetical protein